MRAVMLIAEQTIRESVRDRVLWAFLGAALALVGFSLLLGTLSFIEQVKITIDLGLALIHFLALVLSIFFGINVIGKEIRHRTVYSVLARPVSRRDYLFGKYCGLMLIVGWSCLFLTLALLGLLALLETSPVPSLFAAVLGIFCEMCVVASAAVLFSLLASPLIASFAAVGWWAAGSFSTDILFFASRAESTATQWVGYGLYYALPRLDLFAVKNRVVYEPTIPFTDVLQFVAYAATLAAVLLGISLLIMQRKEL